MFLVLATYVWASDILRIELTSTSSDINPSAIHQYNFSAQIHAEIPIVTKHVIECEIKRRRRWSLIFISDLFTDSGCLPNGLKLYINPFPPTIPSKTWYLFAFFHPHPWPLPPHKAGHHKTARQPMILLEIVANGMLLEKRKGRLKLFLTSKTTSSPKLQVPDLEQPVLQQTN